MSGAPISAACQGLACDELLAQHALAEHSLPGFPNTANVARTLNWAAGVGAASVWLWLARAYPEVNSEELNNCMVRAADAGQDLMLDIMLEHAGDAGVNVPTQTLNRAAELMMVRDRALGRAFVARQDLPARIGSAVIGLHLVLYAHDLFGDVLPLSTWVITLFHTLRSVPEREQAVLRASPRLLDRWIAHAQHWLPELEHRFGQQDDFAIAWGRVMGELNQDEDSWACMMAARHLAAGRVLQAVRAWPGKPETSARARAKARASAEAEALLWGR